MRSLRIEAEKLNIERAPMVIDPAGDATVRGWEVWILAGTDLQGDAISRCDGLGAVENGAPRIYWQRRDPTASRADGQPLRSGECGRQAAQQVR